MQGEEVVITIAALAWGSFVLSCGQSCESLSAVSGFVVFSPDGLATPALRIHDARELARGMERISTRSRCPDNAELRIIWNSA